MDPILRGFGYFFSPNGQAKNLLKNQMNEEKVSFHRGKMHFNSIENSSLVNHTWKWLPQTKEGEIKFEAVFKLLISFQGGVINIISLLGELKGKADENLQIAGTGVGIFVFSACSYLALANFSEAVQVLKSDVKDKYSQAAKKVAIALGAASGGFVSLSGALANLSKTAIIPAGTVLGTSATMACVGLGPIINDIRGVYLHMGKGEFK